jgi:hypothetical protein
MNQEMNDMFRAAEGRYLTPDEGRRLVDEAAQLERRLAVMRAVEQVEQALVQQTVEGVYRRFPKFFEERPQARQKCERDVTLTLRYCVLAMVRNDPGLLQEKLILWMSNVLRALDMREICQFTYETLEAQVKKTLTADESAMVGRYVRLVAEGFKA